MKTELKPFMWVPYVGAVPVGHDLSVATVVVSTMRSSGGRTLLLEHAQKLSRLVEERCSTLQTYLFYMSRGLVADSAVNRSPRLWRRKAGIGTFDSPSSVIKEGFYREDGQLRHHGIVKAVGVPTADLLLATNGDSGVVLALLEKDWEGRLRGSLFQGPWGMSERSPDVELVARLARMGAVCVILSDEFNDETSDLCAYGAPSTLLSLAATLECGPLT